MVRILSSERGEFELCGPSDRGTGDGRKLAIDPTGRFIAKLAADTRNSDALRRVVAKEFGIQLEQVSPGERWKVIQRLFRQERLWLRRRAEIETEPARPEENRGFETHEEKEWIAFRVLWDDTGKPVGDVELTITDPSEATAQEKTNAAGMIERRAVRRGAFQLCCSSESPSLETTLDFVGTGEVLDPDLETPNPYAADLSPGPFFIRQVATHRVRDGETLETIAGDFGLSWEDLAKFNFGTSDRKEVAKHLRFEIGCTRMDGGGQLMMSDADEPGILLVPREWARSGLRTGHTHDVRVRRIRRGAQVRIECPFLGLLAKHDVKLTYADGSSESAIADANGTVLVKTDRWSDDGNFVDIEVTTNRRERKPRVFVVCEHADTVNGAWQRLVNLGYVHTLKPPKVAPAEEEVFAACLEQFQAHVGIAPTGELDHATAARLRMVHAGENLWVDAHNPAPSGNYEGRAKDEIT